MQIKFDALKAKALAALFAGVRSQFQSLRWSGANGIAAVRYAKMTGKERADLVAFADSFPQPKEPDPLVVAAKDQSPFAMSLLRDREAKATLINRCDARQAGALIREFPGIVPKKFQAAAFEVYMADDADSTWMVEFDDVRATA